MQKLPKIDNLIMFYESELAGVESHRELKISSIKETVNS